MVKSWMFWIVGMVMIGGVAATSISADVQSAWAAAPNSATSTPSSTTSTSNPLDQTSLAEISTSARYAVEVLNLDTGASASYGEGSFDTASIVKVDILAALLHQAQEGGRSLTASEMALAEAMIGRSDNGAATTLFNAIGGEAGLGAFNDLIGLTDTDVGSDGYWGLTQTTTADQIRVLKIVFGDDSVLDSNSQAYAQSLMANVISSQYFGVSAAGDDAAPKVGYLQRLATGLWDVNSIGAVEVDGNTYLVAVLSGDNTSYDKGVALVEEVVRATVAAEIAI